MFKPMLPLTQPFPLRSPFFFLSFLFFSCHSFPLTSCTVFFSRPVAALSDECEQSRKSKVRRNRIPLKFQLLHSCETLYKCVPFCRLCACVYVYVCISILWVKRHCPFCQKCQKKLSFFEQCRKEGKCNFMIKLSFLSSYDDKLIKTLFIATELTLAIAFGFDFLLFRLNE